MKHYILYSHDGSENHGCEALVRTTCKLLQGKNTLITLSSKRPEQDIKYGIDKICDVHGIHEKVTLSKYSVHYIKAAYYHRVKKDRFLKNSLAECRAYDAKKGDIALSIGGDTYCYGATKEMAYRNRIWKQGGLKTVFWGCSIEPELLNDKDIANDIATFDLITARETISYEALKKVNPNTILISDSAFILDTAEMQLPKGFDNNDIVGINISPLVKNYESLNGIIQTNYERLVEYILNNTELKILLIPHVIWTRQDDRDCNSLLYSKYKDSKRIVEIDDCNCEELKGYISKCKYFVGARTHATIAAYSSFVPTLVVGYSVKSIGIARDLFGTDTNYVIDSRQLTNECELTNSFIWLKNNEFQIKNRLLDIMPEYKNRVLKGVNAVIAL